MEIVVTDITTQVEIEAGQELFEVIVTVADSESAERFAIEAKESADEAAISEDITTVKASEAVVSASNALNSEIEAENAATTATEQAILSAAARDEAVAAKLAAEDSEDNALISALDASLFASNALASKNAAELAASQIVDKIDFTGAVEGDLYRVNALGVAEPINETEFLRSKVPFEKSLLISSIIPENTFFWHSRNFNDPVSYSGQLFSTFIAPTEGRGIPSISNPNLSINTLGTIVRLVYNPQFSENDLMFFYVDNDNYISISGSRRVLRIKQTLLGVTTTLSSVALITELQLATTPCELNIVVNSNNRNIIVSDYVRDAIIYFSGYDISLQKDKLTNYIFSDLVLSAVMYESQS